MISNSPLNTPIIMVMTDHLHHNYLVEQKVGKAAKAHLRMKCGDDELRRVVTVVCLAGQHASHSRPAHGASASVY